MSKKNKTARLCCRIPLVAVVLVTVLSLMFMTFVVPRMSVAAPSTNLNFQARLLSGAGAVVADGDYSIEFKVYNTSSGGTALWTETQPTTRVVNGYLSVQLGSVTAFPTTINWDQEHWLTMNVNADGEMNPRLKLTAVPYAFQAGEVAKTSGANRGTLKFNSVSNNPDIDLPNASGTVCLQTATDCGFASSSGSGNYIQNTTTLQANANFAIQSAATTSISALIRARASQTADLLQFQNSGGTAALSGINSAGNLYYRDAASGFVATLGLAGLSDNRSILLPNAGGTICTTVGNCAGVGGTGDILNGGQNGPITIGTNDNTILTLESNNSPRITILGGGNVGIGDTTPAAALTVGNGDLFQVNSSGEIAAVTGYSQGSGNFLQSGIGTFGTGTGAVSLNGATSVTGSNTLTVGSGATTLGGTLAVTGLGTFNGSLTVSAGGTFTNASSSLFTAITIANLPTGGNIGTAAATVDIATTFNVNQTTSLQTLSIPAPTVTTAGRIIYVSNVGSVSFTMNGVLISPSNTAIFQWNGSTWTSAGIDGSGTNFIQNQNSGDQTANFRITGTGQALTSFISPLFGSANAGGATGAVSLRTGNITGANSNTTGSITIKTGDVTNGATNHTGSVTIDAGAPAGSGVAGSISIGNLNASALTLGRSGLNVSMPGTINTNTFTSSALTFGAASTAAIQSAASQALNITGNAASTIATTAGNLTLQGGSGTVSLGSSTNMTAAGALTLGTGSGDLTIDPAGNLKIIGSTSDSTAAGLEVVNSGGSTSLFYVRNDGNIGIGTTSPGVYRLNVQGGNVNFSGNLATGGTDRLTSSGALSNITGYSQTSGNFLQSGTGTFGTGTGAISLNGATSVTGSNTLTVGTGATNLGGTLTVSGLSTFNGNLTVSSASGYYYGGTGSPLNLELTRTIPTIVNDYVEIGNFSLSNGAHNFRVSITNSNSSFAAAKNYNITAYYGQTLNIWKEVVPSVDSGPYGGNDYALDINIVGNGAFLRLRRTSGTTAGTAKIRIESLGQTDDVFTATSATGSAAAPTDKFGALYYSQRDNRVGIGTTNPSAAFQVGPDTGVNSNTVITGGDLRIGNYGSGIGYLQARDASGTANIDLQIRVQNAGTALDAMRITSIGRVGIGITAPVTKLDMRDANKFVGNAADAGVSSGAVNLSVVTTDAQAIDTGGILGLGGATNDDGTGLQYFGGVKAGKENSTAANKSGYLSLFTSSDYFGPILVERVRVTSTGNVGIGTTNPGTFRLNVQGGNVNFSGSTTSSSFIGVGSSLTALNASNVSSGTLGDSYLTSNVALLNRSNQIFTGSNIYRNDSFELQNASSGKLLVADGSALTIKIGGGDVSPDGSPVVLVLDNKSTDGDPSGVEGALYFNNATKTFRCYADGAWSDCGVNHIERGFVLEDDFLSGSSSTSSNAVSIGSLNWGPEAVGGGTSFLYNPTTTQTPTSDRPGIFRIRTNNSVAGEGAFIRLAPSGNPSVVLAAGNVIKAAISVGATASTSQLARVGAFEVNSATTRRNTGVWWEADPSQNANWVYCYGTGSAATCAASTVAIAATTFARLEIRITSTGSGTSAATFLVNGTSYTVSNVTIGTATLVAPTFQCHSITAGTRDCYIDYYRLQGTTSAPR
jgi:hypothetical protein